MDGRRKAASASHAWPEPGHRRTEAIGSGEEAPHHLLILSDIRFLREGLAAVLVRDCPFAIVDIAADLDEALAAATVRPSPLILIDAALPDGRSVVARLRQLVPSAHVVALALSETEADVIAWAEAGVCGYVPRSTPLIELADILGKIMRREQVCTSRIAAGLLRWIADSPRAAGPAAAVDAPVLTVREDEVVRLIAAGLSNKEIARRLDIGLATVKSHVHNLLGKLALARRSQVAQWMRHHEPGFGRPQELAPQPAQWPSTGGARASGLHLSPSSLNQEMDCQPQAPAVSMPGHRS